MAEQTLTDMKTSATKFSRIIPKQIMSFLNLFYRSETIASHTTRLNSDKANQKTHVYL